MRSVSQHDQGCCSFVHGGHEIMSSKNKTARLAGFLYLLTVMTGAFSLLYVPSQIIVHDNATATVSNIIASESLFRAGIAVGSLSFTVFLLLPLVLYKLLNPVDRTAAVLMVTFAMISVPIDFVAIADQLNVLSLLHGSEHHNVFAPDQLQANVMLSVDAYYNKIVVSEIFWGLWLLPFGYLVFNSGFLPKVLGVLLMMGCFSYLIEFIGRTLFPHYTIPSFIMWPASLGEIGICLWLLIIGVRTQTRGAD